MTPAKVNKDNALGVQTNMTLKKGATFHHSPTSPSESLAFRVPPLPRRAKTNLDDVVEARLRRVALTLDTIDRSLNTASPSSSSSINKTLDKSEPFALGLLDHDLEDSTMVEIKQEPSERVLRPRHSRGASRHHASDSGLGTSIASTREKLDASKDGKAALAVTRSAASSTEVEKLPGLSAKAIDHIHKRILKPLLAKESLKDFRPVVHDCPRRMEEKEILCLRDLEKTLLLTAPVSEVQKDSAAWATTHRSLLEKGSSKTSALYLDFCLTTVECLQATVGYLNEREQTRHGERPYTENYFTDLVDQIRRYASQISESKEQGHEEGDDMDIDAYVAGRTPPRRLGDVANTVSSSDEIRLHGGVNVNGQPAELIRVKKDGRAYSLATGLPVEDYEDEGKEPARFKRSLSERLEDEEEIMRSMARRKKNATPEELAPKRCREPGCTKEFKRPCDLTKHEKTHSRPWKCPVPSCKYHEYGWPTEKEMDRHHNDKHSAAPPMFECLYKPCPYKSKRESNCKQHMEKAHGWNYVRTKTNRKKSGAKSVADEPTPLIGNLPTPKSGNISGVATPPEDRFNGISDGGLIFPFYSNGDMNPLNPPQLSGFPQNLDGLTFDLSPVDTGTPSTDSGRDMGLYEDMTNQDLEITEDIYGAHVQIPELRNPDAIFGKSTAPFAGAYEAAVPVTTYDAQAAPATHISPIGEGNLMLYTPKSLIDEGFGEDYDALGVGADFLLFDPVGPSTKTGALKPFSELPMTAADVPSVAAGYSQPSSQDFYQPQMDWSAHDSYNYPEH